jgi:hypothetical protein
MECMQHYRATSISHDISSCTVGHGGVHTMPDENLLSLAREMRARAEEVLTRAENFDDLEARRTMYEIAESYVKLARRLEAEAGGAEK